MPTITNGKHDFNSEVERVRNEYNKKAEGLKKSDALSMYEVFVTEVNKNAKM